MAHGIPSRLRSDLTRMRRPGLGQQRSRSCRYLDQECNPVPPRCSEPGRPRRRHDQIGSACTPGRRCSASASALARIRPTESLRPRSCSAATPGHRRSSSGQRFVGDRRGGGPASRPPKAEAMRESGGASQGSDQLRIISFRPAGERKLRVPSPQGWRVNLLSFETRSQCRYAIPRRPAPLVPSLCAEG